ncbi:hypothetical protein EV13_1219 [Prochlorococcus sp. MIT 0702]|nr:hypothetical protein EV12_2481 [Prochlorococcus sp. MIT 0701]KGG29270.1 hypothetical protein EV13_1219 [Prochlorococcus sp. MIT 0702]KGG35312.1 hypothetical protein EV14_0885 [Prochlorococcus sp. MIT 0703]
MESLVLTLASIGSDSRQLLSVFVFTSLLALSLFHPDYYSY